MTDINHPQAVADAARAVEEAWDADGDRTDCWWVNGLIDALSDYWTARRAAREAGYAEVLVSKEAVESLRNAQNAERSIDGTIAARDELWLRATVPLARDLAPLLREP